ncbi:CYTH domain-containing protein [Paenisporosarcina indica]|uniref:CYTH domain-containing protein n=1 Tax=Paenisporosarcina indica TaxID=650093 RepID=UPI00094F58A2|nr:CYTH domain-containing protein [Paenisporosarcina indica]
MSIQKEIEFKNLLEKDEFHRLCSGFDISPKDFHTQTNTYFDTIDFKLRNASMGFRLRVLENRNELTLKSPGDNVHTMIEITRCIDTQERDQILDLGTIKTHSYDEFKQLPDALEAFGSLRTKRAEVTYQGGSLVLDCSDYLGHTDYEVEYEVTDAEKGQQIFLSLLGAYQIPIRNTPKKIARFMKMAQQK